MRRIMIRLVLTALVGALVGFGLMWIANGLLEASHLSGASLRRTADYTGAALVIFLLGAAIGCWGTGSWIFLAVVVLTMAVQRETFFFNQILA